MDSQTYRLCGDYLWPLVSKNVQHSRSLSLVCLVFVCCHSNNLIVTLNFNLIPNKLRATEKRAYSSLTVLQFHHLRLLLYVLTVLITTLPHSQTAERFTEAARMIVVGMQGWVTNVDQTILSGEIVAYKIQWFNGRWSGWYVPGVNDIDRKYDIGALTCSVPLRARSLRRVWSYFYDHTHMYIICS